MSAHARLSPSAAKRWLSCPGSVALTEHMPDTSSPYARVGTLCHLAAELCLIGGHKAADLPLDGELESLTPENLIWVQDYVDYVLAIPGDRHYEVKLKLNEHVWGTSDAVVFRPGILDVGDLKTGSGERVEAEENPQLMIYGLMALTEYDFLYGPFDEVNLHIIQTPINNISVWGIAAKDLYQWQRDVLDPGIALALSEDAPLVPSEDACRWCKARATCKARAEANIAIAKAEFAAPVSPKLMDLEQVAALLPKLGDIKKWCADVEEHAYQAALEGQQVPGYKLVEGRSNRYWAQASEAYAWLVQNGYSAQQITKPADLLGITAIEKLVGAKSDVWQFSAKAEGKPTLVPESDKRPELAVSSAMSDFS